MYNISAFDYKLGTIYFLILFFLLIIFKNMTNTSIEGFNASDITSIAGKVGDIASKANEIPGQITDVSNKITDATTNITSAIDTKISAIDTKIIDLEEKILGKVITKLNELGENIGNVINGGIVDPFKLLFIAIGEVFILLFVILKKVGGKIASIPGCFILYWYRSIADPIIGIYRWIMPNFIEDFIYTIYEYTLKVPIDFIIWLFGLDKWWSKCFDLEVDKEVDSIKDAFNDAAKEFRSTFGNMNFKNLVDFSD